MTILKITRPDDWHLHLRDGDILAKVLTATSAQFARAIVMPNLVPPVVTHKEARAYHRRILAHLPPDHAFAALMTLYLTEDTNADDVAQAFAARDVIAVKLYPAGATTNSSAGVGAIERVYPVLERMAEIGMVLCVHGEVVDAAVDIFDREAVFIERVLEPLRQRYPSLRVVLEHVTTKEGVDYVRAAGSNLAATITAHHLIINRNAMLVGGIRPHNYCLPVAKREHHRLALRQAATSGDKRFFFGSDSAPHVDSAKQSACGCAGIFTAPNALSLLAHVFDEENALDKLDGFVAKNGAAFYGLAPNRQSCNLVKNDQPLAPFDKVATALGPITVFDPGFALYWDCHR